MSFQPEQKQEHLQQSLGQDAPTAPSQTHPSLQLPSATGLCRWPRAPRCVLCPRRGLLGPAQGASREGEGWPQKEGALRGPETVTPTGPWLLSLPAVPLWGAPNPSGSLCFTGVVQMVARCPRGIGNSPRRSPPPIIGVPGGRDSRPSSKARSSSCLPVPTATRSPEPSSG